MKSLVILAAWMWSRYWWWWLKQIDVFWPHWEKIMDYSIYDAINAGFQKIIFVIREEFAEVFEKQIIEPLKQNNPTVSFVYVFQKKQSLLPEWFDVSHREKPWWTAHATLVAKEEIDGPFTVINADDWYWPWAFYAMSAYFDTHIWIDALCMVWYILENTLSPHGAVNRGVCEVSWWKLIAINERLKVTKVPNTTYAQDEDWNQFPLNSIVSMNFWWFDKKHLSIMESQWKSFVEQYSSDPKKEWFIPWVIAELIHTEWMVCDVLTSNDPWCWVSYQEDKPFVQQTIQQAIDQWVYPKEPLWSTRS